MSSEDQDQRKSTGMEDSNAMTIDFLRARLLTERSVSKTARQRAEELARRVTQLEEQLKFVSHQRKKAEKATADVLEILEKCGVSDFSEGVDSCSDQDETPHESAGDGFPLRKDTSSKMAKNEMESYSCSGHHDYSPSTGRSLSWKSTKDSQYSLEKKKSPDSVRRRASFSSNCSSARRAGKSCRRIRRRETRSSDELRNDGPEKAGSSKDVSNCSDREHYELGESAGYNDEMMNGTKNINSQYFSVHERHEDMESALLHQAQLIGKYEAEEKAQRDWEEKFRENNSGTQDSCDPGNHSDVTEEQYESKSPRLLPTSGKSTPNNQETSQEPFEARLSSEESQTSKNSPPLPDVNKKNLHDEKHNDMIASKSSAPNLLPYPSKDKSELEISRKHLETSLGMYQQYPPMHHPTNHISHHAVKSTPQFVSPVSSSSLELAVVPQETPSNLGSVLVALQQAKLSLNQKLINSSVVEERNSGNSCITTNGGTNLDAFKVPISQPGLFRLPTDNQFQSANHVESSSCYFPPEIAGRRYLWEPLLDSRNVSFGDIVTSRVTHSVRPSVADFSYEQHSIGNRGSENAYRGDVFLSTPPRPSGAWPGVPPMRSLSQPRLAGPPSFNRTNHFDPYTSPVLPLKSDIALSVPSIEGTSRTFSSSETGLPPLTRLSLYDDLVRKSMQR